MIALATAVLVCLALPTSASAGSVDVKVTARITDTFSLTIKTDGGYRFGEKKPGKRYASPRVPLVEVQSSRPWVMTDTSTDPTITVGGRAFRRSSIVRHQVMPRFNDVMRPGSYLVTCRYWLDLTNKALMTVPEGTPVEADMSYTVLQAY